MSTTGTTSTTATTTTTAWRWDSTRLAADLEGLGYDVDAADADLGGGGSLSARRDRGGRSHLVAVDAGGRFRATVTIGHEADGRSEQVAGVTLRLVPETRQGFTATATLTAPDQLPAVVAALDHLGPTPARIAPPAGEAAFDLSAVLATREQTGNAYLQFLNAGSLSVGLYALPAGGDDPQVDRPHAEDEVYYVLNGRATLRVGNTDYPAAPGAVLFVGRDVEHRFHAIAEDLLLLVFFAPEHARGA